jgi:hypothetical protein
MTSVRLAAIVYDPPSAAPGCSCGGTCASCSGSADARSAAGNAGNPQALIDWYNAGADGQINWGSPGDFEACVAIAGQHIDDPEGFCQERHIDATGEPAGPHAHGGAVGDPPMVETAAMRRHRHLAQAGRHLHAAGILGLGVPLAPELDPDRDGDVDVPGSLDTDQDVGPMATSMGQGVVGAARVASLATLPFADRVPVPEYPPLSWFGRPDWVEGYRAEHGFGASSEVGDDGHEILRLTVTDDGRVGGYWYHTGVCIVDRTATLRPGQHQCWYPEPSPTGYARFHQQDAVVLDDSQVASADGGRLLLVGVVGNSGGHASETAAPSVAARHYADPNAQMMLVRVGDDEHGGWLAGALVPGSTWGDVALLRRCALSGDWRWYQPDRLNPAGGYDSLGPTLVTRPGLALVRPQRAASVEHPDWRPDDEAIFARLAQVTPAVDPFTSISQALPAYGSSNPALSLPLNSAAASLLSAAYHNAAGNSSAAQSQAARATAALQKAAATAAKQQQAQIAQHLKQYAQAVKSAAKGAAKGAAKAAGKGGGKKGGGKGKGGGKKPPALKGHAGPTKTPTLPKGYQYVFGRLVGPDGHVVSGGGAPQAASASDIAAIRAVVAARLGYSPDQARDDHGRFGEGSGGSKEADKSKAAGKLADRADKLHAAIMKESVKAGGQHGENLKQDQRHYAGTTKNAAGSLRSGGLQVAIDRLNQVKGGLEALSQREPQFSGAYAMASSLLSDVYALKRA